MYDRLCPMRNAIVSDFQLQFNPTDELSGLNFTTPKLAVSITHVLRPPTSTALF